MRQLPQVDQVLKAATDRGDVPGVVAMAATREGPVYQGAFGTRVLPDGPAMTSDAVFWIASMTKAITSAAAMQLVDQGRLALDRPIAEVLPELAAPQVLEGFDADGEPKLRPARRPITLRHLITHTAGFVYDIWSPEMGRYMEKTDTPGIISCANAALMLPLAFDPGDKWDYGINIDWVGKMVEAMSGQKLDRYFQDHIFGPLGMTDTSFKLGASQRARLSAVHQRGADGTMAPIEFELPQDPEFHMGGGGLYGTAGDYLTFCRMIMSDGQWNGVQVLRKDTVALMAKNHIGALEIGALKTAIPPLSNDVELFPGMSKKWGLSFLINTQPGPTGRSANSLFWAGLANTYFWIDRTKRVCGVFLSQLLPFYDGATIDLLGKFETEVYRGI